ncbi:MAG: KUP/HAK/KT family potassium transporter [Bacteroidales bacterium]|nr:KUP/HAK/KT family potassium transporter [Bacteroidales bacterium]
MIITPGIVYGDIGTSPLYVVKAIFGNIQLIDQNIILGSVSCIFWTLTIQTTLKYVLITLNVSNIGLIFIGFCIPKYWTSHIPANIK